MKQIDEDYAFEVRRQAMLDAEYKGPHIVHTLETRRQARLIGDWTNASLTTQIHQKVGVVVPFSRTTDKDPWARIPLSVPENSYPKISKREALFWIVVGAMLAAWWL